MSAAQPDEARLFTFGATRKAKQASAVFATEPVAAVASLKWQSLLAGDALALIHQDDATSIPSWVRLRAGRRCCRDLPAGQLAPIAGPSFEAALRADDSLRALSIFEIRTYHPAAARILRVLAVVDVVE